MEDLRGTAPILASFHAGLDATRESVRLSPWYWGQRQTLATYTIAGGHLDNALRNLRVLARQAAIALDRDDVVPAAIPHALLGLADGVESLGPAIAGEAEVEPVRAVILERGRGHCHDLRRGPVHRPDGGPDPAVRLRPAAGHGHDRERGRDGDPCRG